MITWFPNHLKSCFRSLPVFLFLLLGIPGCAQGGDSPSGGRSPALLYEEDSPLDHFLKVEIFSDFTVSISNKTMKPFCAVPSADSCWQETKMARKISAANYDRLFKFVLANKFESLPQETDLTPGAESIYVSFPASVPAGGKSGWVRVNAATLVEYPALKSFQKILREVIGDF